jgi:UDP-N-acetylmuramyl pentapeptide phosphotransferase/UDP-N-acetylglucosamine-1-phosphate transferase
MTDGRPGLLIAFAIALAFSLSSGLSALLARGRLPWLHVLDHPNRRSLHSQSIPRSGGIAVLCGFFAAIAALALAESLPPELSWLLSALVLVAGVSFVDDHRGLSRRLRLLVHLLAAAVLWIGGLRWDMLGLPGLTYTLPMLVALPLTILFVVWMLNLYNFMDGMDGLAGGMAVLGFGALGAFGISGEDLVYATSCFAVAAASAGFLTANLPPARLFLGDVGSSSLGLLAAGFILWGGSQELFPIWAGLLIFSPFIVDATWTLARRAAHGERVWEAHRSHHYQRLVMAGWGHRRTLAWALSLICAAAATAFAAARLPTTDQWLIICGWAGVFVLVHIRVGIAEHASKDSPL